MEQYAQSPLFWLALTLIVVGLYVLPTVIALFRQVDDIGLVVAINFIGGPTGVGWLAALILSIFLNTREVREPPRRVVGYEPGCPPPPDDDFLAAVARAGGNPAYYWRS